mgnify:FL=1
MRGKTTWKQTLIYRMRKEALDREKFIANPYKDLNKKNPPINFLKSYWDTDLLNSYKFRTFYCLELFGFKLLRPYLNYSGDTKEMKGTTNSRIKDHHKH